MQEKVQQIEWLLLDVDGVLTDGRLLFGSDGVECKAFNTLDGHGIKMLQRSGIAVGIVSGRRSEPVARRARDLGIELLVQGREDKWQALQEVLQEQPRALASIAFMGDDWPDLAVMCRVGLALAPANAHPEVLNRAHWCSQRRGGEGAVREACDMILTLRGQYGPLLAQATGEPQNSHE